MISIRPYEKDTPRLERLVFLSVMIMSLAGCNLVSELPAPPAAVVAPVLTQQAPPDAAPLSDTWQASAQGLEMRQLLPNNDLLKTLVAVRLDPNLYTFRAYYRPGAPLTLKEWQAQLPDAQIIINANFFHPDHTVIGMVITDEGAFGRTLVGSGGMFSVENGMPVLQSLVERPYDGRWLDHAVQGFPNLIVNSAASQTNLNDNRPSRRTVIGTDAAGRIVILSTPLLGLGLYDLSQYLAQSDLQLVNAINLDGGGSTMLHVAPASYQILSFDPVPTVLAAYKK